MRDWTEVPEASGPQSESDLGQGSFAAPGWRIGAIVPPQAYPEFAGTSPETPPDPALAAVERTIAAERAADALKTVPEDALEV